MRYSFTLVAARRVVIYPRVSQSRRSDESRSESDSISAQVADLQELADREGHRLVRPPEYYADDGISAFKGVPRPGFSRLLADLPKGIFDRVLVRHDDRLFRNDEEAAMFRAACAKAGVDWQTASGSVTDPSTAQGGLLASVAAAIGAYESQVKRERLLSHYEDKRQRGELLPAHPTFGWDHGDRRTADPVEAAYVRWAFEHVALGGSVGAVVRKFNDEGVQQVRGGKRWAHGTIVKILSNPRYAGLQPGADGAPLADVRGAWDAIVTPELFEQAQAARRRRVPKTLPRNNFSTVHLLGGIMICGVCGSPMASNGSTQRQGSSVGVYRCNYNLGRSDKDGRRHASIRVDVADEAVRRAIVAAFMFGGRQLLPQDDATVDLIALGGRADGVRAARQELLSLVTTRSATADEVRARLHELALELEEIEEQRQEALGRSASARMLDDVRREVLYPGRGQRLDLDAAVSVGDQLRERLNSLHIEKQRDLARRLLDVVALGGRASASRPTRLEITHRVVTSLNDDESEADDHLQDS